MVRKKYKKTLDNCQDATVIAESLEYVEEKNSGNHGSYKWLTR
jgi:hypothetical protein